MESRARYAIVNLTKLTPLCGVNLRLSGAPLGRNDSIALAPYLFGSALDRFLAGRIGIVRSWAEPRDFSRGFLRVLPCAALRPVSL